MTDLLERPAPDAAAHGGPTGPAHDHTARCWGHPYDAGWVCPPGGPA